jgi:hypothetical protein
MSKVQSIEATLVQHYTTGQIARASDLSVTYIGTLAPYKWLSIIDDRLNKGLPCQSALEASTTRDPLHSGSVRATAGTKGVVFDTRDFAASSVLAVCYTEAEGNTAAHWMDSGIRITMAKILSVGFGSPARKTTVVTGSRDVLPQVPNVVLTYDGILASDRWISLVDSTLNNNNPCVAAGIAAHTADSTHTGVMRAPANTKAITIPQDILLNFGTLFAVCYAEETGTITDDSWQVSLKPVTICHMCIFVMPSHSLFACSGLLRENGSHQDQFHLCS